MTPLLLALTVAQATAPAAAPVWELRETANAQTGAKSTRVTVIDPASESRLIVRCDVVTESVISVQFIPKTPLAPGKTRTVTLTLDSAKAEMAEWELPGRGAYVADPATVFIYASSFAKAKRIQVGMADDAGQTIGGDFVGPGDDSLFRKVFAACGRDYAMPPATPPAPVKK